MALAEAGLLSAEMLVLTAAFFISLIGFSYLAKEVFIDKDKGFDDRVFRWAARLVSARNNDVMQAITFLGTHKFLIPANLLLTFYFLVIRRHKWYSIKVAAISLSSTMMMLLLKLIFSRARPLIPLLKPALGYSFPSGHSMMSFVFYGLLVYMAYKYVRQPGLKWTLIVTLSLLILMIGFSRIYLRVHYPTDVLAGFLMGMFWLIGSVHLLNRLEQYSKRRLRPVVEEGAPA